MSQKKDLNDAFRLKAQLISKMICLFYLYLDVESPDMYLSLENNGKLFIVFTVKHI